MKKAVEFIVKKSNVNLLFCALLFLLFLIFRLVSKIYFLEDSVEYIHVAEQINNFSSLDTKRPIIYPLFLIIGLHTYIICTIILQTFIGIFTVGIFLNVLRINHVDFQRKYLWFLLFTPSIFIYTQLIMSEWLVLFFITMLLWLVSCKWSVTNFAFIQIVTVLLAFTKPVFYPFIYLNLFFFTIYFIKIRFFSFWIFFPILILQLYLGYNENKTGFKHFSSIENINLINYNLYYFKSSVTSKKEADKWLAEVYNQRYQYKSFKEQNSYLQDIARQEIRQNFISYSFYHLFTAIRGTFDPGRFDLMTFFKKEDGKQGFLELLNTKKSVSGLLATKFAIIYILLIPIFVFNLIKWFYFCKYLLLNKINGLNFYLLMLLFYTILITGPVNCSRYMMPLQSIIFFFAILGFTTKSENKSA